MGNKGVKKIIVNSISIIRIIGSILLPFLFKIVDIPVLITLIIILFITDSLDGFLARRWQVQTRGGALLDPLGDKLLAVSCTIAFAGSHPILLLILGLEIFTLVLNIYRSLHGEQSVTLIIGKIKMWLLSITLILCAIYSLKSDYLSTITITYTVILYASIITICLQLITIVYYIKDSLKQKSVRIKKVPKLKNFKEILKVLFDENVFAENKEKPLLEIIKE